MHSSEGASNVQAYPFSSSSKVFRPRHALEDLGFSALTYIAAVDVHEYSN